jgi:hypothetical protein
VTDFSLYSDRIDGPLPRTHEALTEETVRGLVGLIGRRIDSHWLASEFPEHCPDGSGIVGTNRRAISDEIEALIPGVEWPPRTDIFADEATFDLVEYVARHVATPTNDRFHSFFQHYELSFDQAEGRRRFRDDVNLLLARGRTVFELNEDLRVERRGVPETQVALDQLRPATGDDTLDQLIEAGRKGYLPQEGGTRNRDREALGRVRAAQDPRRSLRQEAQHQRSAWSYRRPRVARGHRDGDEVADHSRQRLPNPAL